jgi:outer membrane receptor protein involved in Fe transport
MKRQILLLTLISMITSGAFSQPMDIVINGKVTNEKNEPMPKVTVIVKNSKAGVATDDNGTFRINIPSLPVMLTISHTNYTNREIEVTDTKEVVIRMEPAGSMLEGVVLTSKGIPTRIKDAPFSAEIIGIGQIRHLPTTSAYDAIVYKKGFDQTSSSLTFKTPSTRGFNGSGSTRVNQLVDGMDNQAPGLNFFVGNFAGLTELDNESIELLPGASSALYGPGGMNGTVLINSKNPFKYPGLSVMIKPGVMHLGNSGRIMSMYHDYSLRWAKNFNDKFAFKISAQYISADDWLASDTSNYLRSGTSGKLIPGNRATDPNYDGVNVYGDETSVDIFPFLGGALPAGHPLVEHINVSRTGYTEKDMIDPETKNIKLSGALHYRITDKIEAQLMGYWGTGNTVYTDDNRYALKGIKIGQYKLELKHKNWFFRTYTTQEDAGEAYSATITSQLFNEAWKRSFNPADINGSWYPQFTGAYLMARSAGADKPTALNMARDFADQGRPEAGSQEFNQIFDQVRKTPIPNGGMFKEKSQLWMTEGQYTFGDAIKNAEIIVGGNYKRYILNSGGTLFIDTLNPIGINEVGAYAQVTKKLFEQRLTLTASGRFDKNENFKAQFTPRFAALIKLAKDNNLRLSYQTDYRFPGNLAQWIRLDVGGDYLLLGGNPWVMDYMQTDKNPVHQIIDPNGGIDPNPYVYKEFKPETMSSFEVGYRGVIKDKLMIDAYTYFGKYEDFIGRIGLYQPNTGAAYSITVNSTNNVKTYGFGLGLDYRMGNKYSVFFNAYSDVITDVPAGFKSYFNAPKYRVNAGIANSGLGKKQLLSFSIMMRWQDAFEWEGELANGPLNAFATADAQVSYIMPKIKSTLRLGGTNILNHYYKNAYANPSIGALYYAAYIFNL